MTSMLVSIALASYIMYMYPSVPAYIPVLSSLFNFHSGEKGNPTYVPPEVAVETTEFVEEVELNW